MQKNYLARVVSLDPAAGMREGILPPEGDLERIAATPEFDGTERIRPRIYVRMGGRLDDVLLPPHPLRRYDGPRYPMTTRRQQSRTV